MIIKVVQLRHALDAMLFRCLLGSCAHLPLLCCVCLKADADVLGMCFDASGPSTSICCPTAGITIQADMSTRSWLHFAPYSLDCHFAFAHLLGASRHAPCMHLRLLGVHADCIAARRLRLSLYFLQLRPVPVPDRDSPDCLVLCVQVLLGPRCTACSPGHQGVSPYECLASCA